MTKELSMDVSALKEALNWKPDQKDLKLYLLKMRECLSQLKELESQWEAMDKPSPDEAGLPKFRKFWSHVTINPRFNTTFVNYSKSAEIGTKESK